MICEYCLKALHGLKKKIIKHVNVSQDSREHYFCSHSCKDRWCFRLQRATERILVVWSIGSYLDRFFFVKKLVKVRNASQIGSEGKKSFFTAHIVNIDSLELVESNGRKMLKVRS